jgi:hypothetical protein
LSDKQLAEFLNLEGYSFPPVGYHQAALYNGGNPVGNYNSGHDYDYDYDYESDPD